jgi:hypothetical protein
VLLQAEEVVAGGDGLGVYEPSPLDGVLYRQVQPFEDGAVEVWVRLRPEDYARLSADGRAVEVLEGPVETS